MSRYLTEIDLKMQQVAGFKLNRDDHLRAKSSGAFVECLKIYLNSPFYGAQYCGNSLSTTHETYQPD